MKLLTGNHQALSTFFQKILLTYGVQSFQMQKSNYINKERMNWAHDY